MAGQAGGQPPMQGHHQGSPDSEEWHDPEYPTQPFHNDSPVDPRQQLSMGFLKGFPAMQKKTTRDGQIPKRRGPKPDSKPAQTRRQELNRQAQRTHRQRKEHYIKALELELDRVKGIYIDEANQASQVIQQQQQENALLREIIVSRGINIEGELASRKAGMPLMIPKPDSSSLPPGQMPTSTLPQHHNYLTTAPSTTTAYSPARKHPYSNAGGTRSISAHSPGTTHYSNSPAGPEVQEFSIKQEYEPVAAMPGIFEREPQLAVDFILQLEQTCRDHGEYLVRRSIASPDEPEGALFSGHALMASVPPVRHVKEIPAQQGGLLPTHPHQMADTETLQILHNLLRTSSQAQNAMNLLGGQVTPVMAMQSLRNHRNYQSMTEEDVRRMIDSVKGNVKCYGFGAVMEDFELRDAINGIFATKPESYEAIGNDYSGDIDDMYS